MNQKQRKAKLKRAQEHQRQSKAYRKESDVKTPSPVMERDSAGAIGLEPICAGPSETTEKKAQPKPRAVKEYISPLPSAELLKFDNADAPHRKRLTLEAYLVWTFVIALAVFALCYSVVKAA